MYTDKQLKSIVKEDVESKYKPEEEDWRDTEQQT